VHLRPLLVLVLVLLVLVLLVLVLVVGAVVVLVNPRVVRLQMQQFHSHRVHWCICGHLLAALCPPFLHLPSFFS
jgi:hypothetical protein